MKLGRGRGQGRGRGPAAAVPSRAADWALVLLLVTPAVFLPGALNRFTFPTLTVAAIGSGVAFAASTSTTAGRLARPVRWLLIAGGTIVLVATLVSAEPWVSLLGRAPRYEGLPVLAVYLLAGLAGARLLGPARSDRTIRLAIQAMAWCAIAVAALAAMESLGLRPLSSDVARPGSLLGNASEQGAFGVLFGGPLLIAALRRRRALPIAGAVAALLSVVLSGSRGALVGAAFMLLIVAVTAGRRWWKQLVGVAVAAAGVVMVIPFTRDRLLGTSSLAGKTVGGRELLWRESLSLLSSHPLFGVGPSQFENAIVPHHDLTWQKTIGPTNPPGSPHNLLLQVWSAGGLLLLVVLLALTAVIVRAVLRDWKAHPGLTWTTGTAAGLAGYAVALQFHLTSPGTTIPACLFAGSLLAVRREPRATTGRRARPAGLVILSRWAAPTLAALLALGFAAASIGEWYLKGAAQSVANGDYAAADADFRTARVLRPWDVELPGVAMTAFVKAGTTGVAGAGAALPYAADWAARLGPVAGDEQLVQNRAALMQAQGDLAGAAALLDRQLEVDPHHPGLLTLRGVVHAQRHEYDAAVADFEYSLRVDPTDPQPWHDLAFVYHARGQTELADSAQAKAEELAAGQ